ncbi:trypsin-like serine protease [Bdellovibrionota bacterium FG-2]
MNTKSRENKRGSNQRFSLSAVIALSFALSQTAFAGNWDKFTDDNNWIVGGSLVNATDVISKSTVGLINGGALCTASIIDVDLAVTAAHCVEMDEGIGLVFAQDMRAPKAKVVQVTGVVVNPTWWSNQSNEKNTGDIALVSFAGGIPAGFSKVKLLTKAAALKKGGSITLAGYGITDAYTQVGAGTLRKADVTILNPKFSTTEILFDQSSGRGGCHGDSGGPAFIKSGADLLLVGVTSRGYPANAPDDCIHQSIYTKITSYSSFLKKAAKTLRGK